MAGICSSIVPEALLLVQDAGDQALSGVPAVAARPPETRPAAAAVQANARRPTAAAGTASSSFFAGALKLAVAGKLAQADAQPPTGTQLKPASSASVQQPQASSSGAVAAAPRPSQPANPASATPGGTCVGAGGSSCKAPQCLADLVANARKVSSLCACQLIHRPCM